MTGDGTAETSEVDVIAPRDRVRARTDQRAAVGYRDVLAIPAFRRLWIAQMLAAFGEALAGVALPLLAYQMTGSAELTSRVFVAQLLPRVLLAPIAGVLADRLDRRRLILAADLGRAGLVVLLPFAGQAWQIATLALLVAVGSALARPAELAALPAVVAPAQLVQALSVSQVAGGLVRVARAGGRRGDRPHHRPAAGVPVARHLLRRLASPSCSGCRCRTLPVRARAGVPEATAGAMSREFAGEALAGLRAVWHNPIVRGTAAVEALWQTVVAVFVVALVVYVENPLRLGAAADSVYSLLMATVSAGATAGALIAGRVERWLGRPRLMAIGYLAPLMLLAAGRGAAAAVALPLLVRPRFHRRLGGDRDAGVPGRGGPGRRARPRLRRLGCGGHRGRRPGGGGDRAGHDAPRRRPDDRAHRRGGRTRGAAPAPADRGADGDATSLPPAPAR